MGEEWTLLREAAGVEPQLCDGTRVPKRRLAHSTRARVGPVEAGDVPQRRALASGSDPTVLATNCATLGSN